MNVVKTGWFEAAHVLSDYDGPCGNLHGHSYRYEVMCGGDVDEQTDMVLDFNEIKKVVSAFDHALIIAGVGARDAFEEQLFHLILQFGKRHVIMPERQKPTCENMSRLIAKRICDLLPDGAVVDVKL